MKKSNIFSLCRLAGIPLVKSVAMGWNSISMSSFVIAACLQLDHQCNLRWFSHEIPNQFIKLPRKWFCLSYEIKKQTLGICFFHDGIKKTLVFQFFCSNKAGSSIPLMGMSKNRSKIDELTMIHRSRIKSENYFMIIYII